MQGVELLGAGIVLLGTIVIGLILHELAHAIILHILGVPYEIRWFPERQQSRHILGRRDEAWASVAPCQIPAWAPTWGIQLSAIAPLLLTVPFLLIVVGVHPNSSVANSPYFLAWAAGWLGCALPSPQDFSVFWHADTVISNHDGSPATND